MIRGRVHERARSRAAAGLLDAPPQRMPFAVTAIPVDGGFGWIAGFKQAAASDWFHDLGPGWHFTARDFKFRDPPAHPIDIHGRAV